MGALVDAMAIPRPSDLDFSKTEFGKGKCVSLPQQAQCGVFMGAEEDGCEADLFVSEGCDRSAVGNHVGTARFGEMMKAEVGVWRSMFIRCGVQKIVGMDLR